MNWLIALVALFVGAVFMMQYLAIRRARLTEGRPAPDTSAVDGEAGNERRRVYYFYSAHCGPCRATTHLVDRLRADHRNLIKANVAETPELARGFGIAATPSFVLVEGGVIRQVKLGGLSERQLLALLQGEWE